MKFSVPTMGMMVFMSLYQTVDGVFISNLVGEIALTALNVVYPFTSAIIGVAIMLATGSSAIIALNMGQGRKREAKENFTFVAAFGIVISTAIAILGLIFIEPILSFLGTTPRIYKMCREYLSVMIVATPMCVLQLLFQTFFVTAGKPKLGLILTAASGITNVVLDALFVGAWHMGIFGAAVATALGYSVTAVYGLVYFALSRNGQLYFVKPKLRWRVLAKTCMNGISEMVNNLSVAITTLLFNVIGIHYLMEEGVAAISIVLYAQFIMTSIFMGYASGVAPIFSFKYGADDRKQIRKIFKISVIFVSALSVLTFLLAFPAAKPIAMVFSSNNDYVLRLAVDGFNLFAVSFLFTGLNIFASSLFTAFSNGAVSGLLSFLRTFVFLVAALILLPMLIGKNGIWLAVPLAEGLAFLLSIGAMYLYRKKYHFVRERKEK